MLARVEVVFIMGVVLAASAHGQSADEYQVKAAYLYNLAKFVEWPAGSFKSATDPVVVCILGQSPIKGALEATVWRKTVLDRPFLIRQVLDQEPVTDCHILFVSSSERNRLHRLIPEGKANGVLTVGEAETFIAEGGVVNFKLDESRVRIQINVEAAKQGHLQISSRLLSLAQIVKK